MIRGRLLKLLTLIVLALALNACTSSQTANNRLGATVPEAPPAVQAPSPAAAAPPSAPTAPVPIPTTELPATAAAVAATISDNDFVVAHEPSSISGTNLMLADNTATTVKVEQLSFKDGFPVWTEIRTIPIVDQRFVVDKLPFGYFRFSAGTARIIVLSTDVALTVVMGKAATAAAAIFDQVLEIEACRALIPAGRFDLAALWEIGALFVATLRLHPGTLLSLQFLAKALCDANIATTSSLSEADAKARTKSGYEATASTAAVGEAITNGTYDARALAKAGGAASGLGTLSLALTRVLLAPASDATTAAANEALIRTDLYYRLEAVLTDTPNDEIIGVVAAIPTADLPASSASKDDAALAAAAKEKAAPPPPPPPPSGPVEPPPPAEPPAGPSNPDPPMPPDPTPPSPPDPAPPPSPSPSPALRVIAPNGGEVVHIGSTQTISWDRTNVTGLVHLDLSRDGGTSFQALYTNVDGSQKAWEVDNIPTSSARIRVVSYADEQVLDTSDANFDIPIATITYELPTTGTFNAGAGIDVHWSSQSLDGTIDVLGSTNNFASFNILASDIPHNNGHVVVQAPGSATASFRLRVRSHQAIEVFDSIGTNLTIAAPSGGFDASTVQKSLSGAPNFIDRPRIAAAQTGNVAVGYQDQNGTQAVVTVYNGSTWGDVTKVAITDVINASIPEVIPFFTTSNDLTVAFRDNQAYIRGVKHSLPTDATGWVASTVKYLSDAGDAPSSGIQVYGSHDAGGVIFKQDTGHHPLRHAALAVNSWDAPSNVDDVSDVILSMAACGYAQNTFTANFIAWGGDQKLYTTVRTSLDSGPTHTFLATGKPNQIGCVAGNHSNAAIWFEDDTGNGSAGVRVVLYDVAVNPGWQLAGTPVFSTPQAQYIEALRGAANPVGDKYVFVAHDGAPPTHLGVRFCTRTGNTIDCDSLLEPGPNWNFPGAQPSGVEVAMADNGSALIVWKEDAFTPPSTHVRRIRALFYDTSLNIPMWTTHDATPSPLAAADALGDPSVVYDLASQKFWVTWATTEPASGWRLNIRGFNIPH